MGKTCEIRGPGSTGKKVIDNKGLFKADAIKLFNDYNLSQEIAYEVI